MSKPVSHSSSSSSSLHLSAASSSASATGASLGGRNIYIQSSPDDSSDDSIKRVGNVPKGFFCCALGDDSIKRVGNKPKGFFCYALGVQAPVCQVIGTEVMQFPRESTCVPNRPFARNNEKSIQSDEKEAPPNRSAPAPADSENSSNPLYKVGDTIWVSTDDKNPDSRNKWKERRVFRLLSEQRLCYFENNKPIIVASSSCFKTDPEKPT